MPKDEVIRSKDGDLGWIKRWAEEVLDSQQIMPIKPSQTIAPKVKGMPLRLRKEIASGNTPSGSKITSV